MIELNKGTEVSKDLVMLALEKGANLESKSDISGWSILHVAAYYGDITLLNKLGKNIFKDFGKEALTLAFTRKKQKFSGALIKKISATELKKIWKELLDNKKIENIYLLVNARKTIFGSKQYKNQALLLAAEQNNIQIVQLLLKQNADPQSQKDEKYPYEYATDEQTRIILLNAFLEQELKKSDPSILKIKNCLSLGANVLIGEDGHNLSNYIFKSKNLELLEAFFKSAYKQKFFPKDAGPIFQQYGENLILMELKKLKPDLKYLEYLVSQDAPIDAMIGESLMCLAIQDDNDKIIDFLIQQNKIPDYKIAWQQAKERDS